MAEIKLKVVYERYERYEMSAPSIGHITAPTFREAIMKMLSRVEMLINAGDLEIMEEELGREMTQEELIDSLNEQNGDGCDFILLLTDETTGEIYMKEQCFEEWTI